MHVRLSVRVWRQFDLHETLSSRNKRSTFSNKNKLDNTKGTTFSCVFVKKNFISVVVF